MSMLSLCVYYDLISTNVSLRFIYITAKMRCFRIRLAGFINLIFFCKDQMAQTNAKTPRFRHNVNDHRSLLIYQRVHSLSMHQMHAAAVDSYGPEN